MVTKTRSKIYKLDNDGDYNDDDDDDIFGTFNGNGQVTTKWNQKMWITRLCETGK